ncbi:uncharacterized [Tachysurus ichikawai]
MIGFEVTGLLYVTRLRNHTSHPAAERRSHTPPLLESMAKQEDRREIVVVFSDDVDRGGPLASGDVTIVRVSEATVYGCKQSSFCVGEGEACKERRVKEGPPCVDLHQKKTG